jgi:pimeloyl-ACP methyl ester carboxylesterase
MQTIIIQVCLVLLLLYSGFLVLRPMSSSMFRYLVWRTTPAGCGVPGNIKKDGATIHYVSYGKGPAILLLHGGLSNRLTWFSQIPELVAAGRQVVIPDVRGHGFSDLGRKELNYRLLAQDAIGVLDQLKIGISDVVGWSDGGNTALLLGKDWPDRVGCIVAISANSNPSGLTPAALEESYTQSHGAAYWIKRWWTGSGEHFASLEKRIKLMWRTFPLLEDTDLKTIEAPTLIIVGRHDIISIGHAKTMAGLLPHGSLSIVPGGHSTPVTHSVQVNEYILKFLCIPQREAENI